MIKRYIKVAVTAFIYVLFSTTVALAEEPQISWDDCVREAKRQHPDLVSAFEKIKQAKASKEITRSAVLPQITGTAAENTSNGVGVTSSGSSGQGVTSLQGGGESASSTRYEYGADLQQLLFDGFKTSYTLSSNQRSIEASRYNYDVTSSNIRLQLRTAYSNLLAAQELVKVTEEIEGRRKQNLELVRLRYEGGREHRGSLLTSEADLAQAVYDVNQAKRNVYLAQRQLMKELGARKFVPFTAMGALEVREAEHVRPDFEKLSDTTPLLRQLIEKKEAAKFDLKSAKAGFFPQIYLTAGESNSNTDAFPDQNQWSLGTSLSLPIFDGGNTIATVQKAKATLGQAEADERSGRDGVIYTLSNTWTQLQNNIENTTVQAKVLEAAEVRARIAEAEYSIGLLIYDNWIIIENALVAAKKVFVNAKLNAMIAEANWVQAKGGTLDYD
ncbi:MAG: TolC family protein [Candidatus Omnitrophota bacterium]